MSLPIHKKLYWKTRNHIEVAVTKIRATGSEMPMGLLSHRKDPHDDIFGGFWAEPPQPKYPEVSTANHWRFDQFPRNICTAASVTMGSSYQEGIRFSAKFTMKLMKKMGMVTGDGFSYIRAPLDISHDFGRLPYEMMPDEVFGPWEEWSKYDITDEMLIEAAKYKSPRYKKVVSAKDAIELLEAGYNLFTGLKWRKDMNRPQEPDFYLNFTGVILGGHAIQIDGARAYNAGTPNARIRDWNTVGTFGVGYGDNGRARIRNIFASGMFEIYFLEKIPGRTDLDRAIGRFDGQCVKGTLPTVFHVEHGQKRPYTMTWETFQQRFGNPTIYSISDELLEAIPVGENIQ